MAHNVVHGLLDRYSDISLIWAANDPMTFQYPKSSVKTSEILSSEMISTIQHFIRIPLWLVEKTPNPARLLSFHKYW